MRRIWWGGCAWRGIRDKGLFPYPTTVPTREKHERAHAVLRSAKGDGLKRPEGTTKMQDREFYADLMQALLDGEDDELILAMLARLQIDKLQDLALAASNLRQLCEMAAEQPAGAQAGEGE